MKNNLKLCLITHQQEQDLSSYLEFISKAILGGVTMLQLRDKSKSFEELKSFAIALQQITQRYNIPLIINDHVQLALEIDADGVHLGKDDRHIKLSSAT
jgi:thiamine-phosphate pyrophosphorylase